MRAWMEQDLPALDSILAPDYALVIATMPERRFERQDWLATAIGTYLCTRFTYEHVQMRQLADDMVVMSAVADMHATMAGHDRSGRFFVTDIWRRAGDAWQVCARFSSPPNGTDESARAMFERSNGRYE
jgi:hypothetical protein